LLESHRLDSEAGCFTLVYLCAPLDEQQATAKQMKSFG
jgi:hypothetical protein